MSTVCPRCKSGAVGSKTRLNTQRLPALELLNQLSLNQNLFCAALDERQLLLYRLHEKPRKHLKTKGNQPYKIAD